jgi:hypothetical protein
MSWYVLLYALDHRSPLHLHIGARRHFRNRRFIEPPRPGPGADFIMRRDSLVAVMDPLPQPRHLNLAEHEMHLLVEDLQAGLVRASDRPEIEARILMFLDHASGPTTAGIAAEMGIGPRAAAVHLEALEDANRIWSQPSHGAEVTWHISLDGQHFIEQRGLR